MFEHQCDCCGLPFESEHEIEDTCPDCLDDLQTEADMNAEEAEEARERYYD